MTTTRILFLLLFSLSTTYAQEGKKVFGTYCVACHGTKGEGTIGPNLTDDYWLHGNNNAQLVKVITNGVSTTAMIAWKTQLNAAQIKQVASYILTLKPAAGKEPQGKKIAKAGALGVVAKTKVVKVAVPEVKPEPVVEAAPVSDELDAKPEVTPANMERVTATGGDYEKGKRLFNGMLGCSHCHGINSVGHSDNRNLRELVKRHGDKYDEVYTTVTREGRTGTAMPSWAHLSTKQLTDLKAFVMSIQENY